MPTKTGRVISLGRRGPKFVEAILDSGGTVELSPAMLTEVRARDPAAQLVFVERRGRLFRYVQWVGTFEEAAQALRDGTLRPNEVPWGVQAVGEGSRG